MAERARKITENTCSVDGDWEDVTLVNPRLKFKVSHAEPRVPSTDLYNKLLDCAFSCWNAASGSDILGLPVYSALV